MTVFIDRGDEVPILSFVQLFRSYVTQRCLLMKGDFRIRESDILISSNNHVDHLTDIHRFSHFVTIRRPGLENVLCRESGLFARNSACMEGVDDEADANKTNDCAGSAVCEFRFEPPALDDQIALSPDSAEEHIETNKGEDASEDFCADKLKQFEFERVHSVFFLKDSWGSLFKSSESNWRIVALRVLPSYIRPDSIGTVC